MKKILYSTLFLVFIFSSFLQAEQMAITKVPQEAWQALEEKLTGKLISVCHPLSKPEQAETFFQTTSPIQIADKPWGLQSTGYYQGWSATASPYAIEALTGQDVKEAITFAQTYQLPIAIKSTGHDYHGRSHNPEALLIWMHKLNDVKLVCDFRPEGAPEGVGSEIAAVIGGGAMWCEVYDEVVNKHHRFILGGGCMSVGAAGGFLQGGGFGHYSKLYGTGGSNLLQAEVVLASGETVVANAYQHADLFWALKGGGGGTFGVVTQVVLKTFEPPAYTGSFSYTLQALSEAAYEKLVHHFLNFYATALNNPYWGEQVAFGPDNTLKVTMMYQGLELAQVENVWAPFYEWVCAQPDLSVLKKSVFSQPGDKLWDSQTIAARSPDLMVKENRSDRDIYYKSDNDNEVQAYWYGMKTRWVPSKLFLAENTEAFAKTIVQASRYCSFAFHFNKGLNGACAAAIEKVKQTPMNPAVLDSPALVIMAAWQKGVVENVPGHEPDQAAGLLQLKKLQQAADTLFAIMPHAGTYINESDYFEANWQEAFWGCHYARLCQIKAQYDPKGVFQGHHLVGSHAQQNR
jgi:FAD/FMN-containing dehydrogenase